MIQYTSVKKNGRFAFSRSVYSSASLFSTCTLMRSQVYQCLLTLLFQLFSISSIFPLESVNLALYFGLSIILPAENSQGGMPAAQIRFHLWGCSCSCANNSSITKGNDRCSAPQFSVAIPAAIDATALVAIEPQLFIKPAVIIFKIFTAVSSISSV